MISAWHQDLGSNGKFGLVPSWALGKSTTALGEVPNSNYMSTVGNELADKDEA